MEWEREKERTNSSRVSVSCYFCLFAVFFVCDSEYVGRRVPDESWPCRWLTPAAISQIESCAWMVDDSTASSHRWIWMFDNQKAQIVKLMPEASCPNQSKLNQNASLIRWLTTVFNGKFLPSIPSSRDFVRAEHVKYCKHHQQTKKEKKKNERTMHGIKMYNSLASIHSPFQNSLHA